MPDSLLRCFLLADRATAGRMMKAEWRSDERVAREMRRRGWRRCLVRPPTVRHCLSATKPLIVSHALARELAAASALLCALCRPEQPIRSSSERRSRGHGSANCSLCGPCGGSERRIGFCVPVLRRAQPLGARPKAAVAPSCGSGVGTCARDALQPITDPSRRVRKPVKSQNVLQRRRRRRIRLEPTAAAGVSPFSHHHLPLANC